MEDFEDHGLFWLPDSPDDKFPGHIKYSRKAGCSLVVVGQPRFSRRPEAFSRILGVVRNKKVSLLGCTRFGEEIYGSGTSYDKYRAQHLFVGQSLIPENSPAFTTTQANYHSLPEWVNRTGFVSIESDSLDELRIQYIRPERQSGVFSRGSVHIDFHWKQDLTNLRERSITEWPSIRIEYAAATAVEQILSDLGSIENLITLCVDAPSPLVSVTLQRRDLPQRNLAGQEFPGSQDPISYMNQPIESVADLKSVAAHEMLLGLEDVGGVETISRWLDHAVDLGYVLGLLMVGRTTQHMYVENRYLNICAAAEAFHRLTHGGVQMSPERFEQLRSRAIESMPDGKSRKWMKGKLRYNEPTLAERLGGLGQNVDPVLRDLVDDLGSWATTVAEVRNRLVHLDRPGSHGFAGDALYWLAESVFSLTRAAMLHHAGIDRSAMARIGSSDRTTWYRDRLDSAIRDSRAVLDRRQLNGSAESTTRGENQATRDTTASACAPSPCSDADA